MQIGPDLLLTRGDKATPACFICQWKRLEEARPAELHPGYGLRRYAEGLTASGRNPAKQAAGSTKPRLSLGTRGCRGAPSLRSDTRDGCVHGTPNLTAGLLTFRNNLRESSVPPSMRSLQPCNSLLKGHRNRARCVREVYSFKQKVPHRAGS